MSPPSWTRWPVGKLAYGCQATEGTSEATRAASLRSSSVFYFARIQPEATGDGHPGRPCLFVWHRPAVLRTLLAGYPKEAESPEDGPSASSLGSLVPVSPSR